MTNTPTPLDPIAQLVARYQSNGHQTASTSEQQQKKGRTGFAEKTLWDWLQVILIPVVLGIYTLVTATNTATQQTAEAEQQTLIMQQQNHLVEEQLKSDTLWKYTNVIQDLIMHEALLQSKPDDNVRIIAKTQTALALKQLNKERSLNKDGIEVQDGGHLLIDPNQERKANLLFFIYQLKLINTQNTLISLNGADLSEAFLIKTNLSNANLSEAFLNGVQFYGTNLRGVDLSRAYLIFASLDKADLRGADLSEASFRGASLERANLSGANFSGTNLSGTDLTGANLEKAFNVTPEQLARAFLLKDAILPDGSHYPSSSYPIPNHQEPPD